MKLRMRLYLVSGLMSLTMMGVIIVETGLLAARQKQTAQRNYVAVCLKDVFELNLLTHELNLFRELDRPVDQMELKLKTLTGRFQHLAVKDVFSASEIAAIKSTLQAIQALLKAFRIHPQEAALPEQDANKNEFYNHSGAQLLQKTQTLYGAFTLMSERLIKQEIAEDRLNLLVQISLLMFLSSTLFLALFFIYRYVVRSFNSLEEGVAKIAAGDMTFKFLGNGTGTLDEIGAVKNVFNGMVVSLNEALEEIKKKNKELETLIHIISHDLKEPLRSVEYFSNIVLERCAPAMEPESQDYLRRSVQGAVRLRHLLEDILTLSKARKVTIPDSMMSTQEIIKRALERLDQKIKESGARIDVSDDFQDLRVEPLWAAEVVYNLVSNALKYTRLGEKPKIEIMPYRSGAEAGIMVQDRGMGVSPELAERIFDLFQRGVGRGIEGTGAGLAIVRAVAEQHGGRAWVEPREGGGSKFIITFKC